ncbi:hypothetical protein CN277_21530 [Bacillus cereus]|uniref:hypothetical protein n=1 Tax=Bacillus cereus TaxID=1396 RepID=UPI000BED98B8|nr:hypothetical protein [Bacillus cereus]PEC76903.1 hypothetical protein CON08_25095 [Bacillus cereus]PEE61032.1 hypothetical protein COM68_00015 [Bacillus cereus]PFC59671.1 hypothetical protein CN267_18640 [Bacillus cereus]PFC98972.1 hypothetical protein CN277_21530 [Bacillus cereus]PFQ10688.1 hypothetical protein COK04_22795 [Bacillus cereus]
MKPDFFFITMYPTISFNEEEILGRLLHVFESNEKFTPTHWGNCETVKIEYNRQEILEKVISERRVSEVHLYRDKSVNYTGSFQVNWSHRSFLNFEFHKSIPKKLWSAFIELSDQIAEIAKPRIGVTQIFWPLSYPWNTERERLQMWMEISSQPIPVRFLPNGPLGLGARTYLSGHILDMFDKESLLNSPGVVSELNWGGTCIDLLHNPLESDMDLLLDSWLSAMKYLEPAQVMALPSFDEDRMGVSFSPNVAWKDYLTR